MFPEALVATLRRISDCLASLGVPFAIVGGIAASRWKRMRATLDVDLLVSVQGIDPNALLAALLAAGFRAKRQPAVLMLGATRLLQLL